MRSITPIRFLLFITLMCVGSGAAAQEKEPAGQSIITGRVIFADTGRPVRRATVTLYTNLNHPSVRTTPANHRGEFRFTAVAAGSYFVIAQAPGIVFPLSSFSITEFGVSGSNIETEQTRVTVNGKNTVRCEVRVVRAGTIKGVITYADKEPVVNGQVVLFRRKGGAIGPFFFEPVFTNDRGMYRIDGLPDGEYFVGLAAGRTPVLVSAGPLGEARGIPTSYYPGVRSLREAKAVQIESGAEVSGINITLDEADLRQISGVVKWRHSGALIIGAAVTVRRKDEPKVDISFTSLFRGDRDDGDDKRHVMRDMGLIMTAMPAMQETGEDGEWLVEDLPPGTYVVTAYAPVPKPKDPAKADEEPDDEAPRRAFDGDGRMVSKQVEVVVEHEDRKDITIELSLGARILGTVIGPDGPLGAPLAISVNQENKLDFLLDLPHLTKDDETFLLEGVPAGEVRLDAELVAPDLYLKSITFGGQDLMREPLRVNEGAEITGVRITIGKGMATLTGRVLVKEDGAPAAGAGVLLVKADSKLWPLRSSRYFASANADGVFRIHCPPGDYVVITWPAAGQPLQEVESFVRSQGPTARTISLQSKEEKQIELTLAARPQ